MLNMPLFFYNYNSCMELYIEMDTITRRVMVNLNESVGTSFRDFQVLLCLLKILKLIMKVWCDWENYAGYKLWAAYGNTKFLICWRVVTSIGAAQHETISRMVPVNLTLMTTQAKKIMILNSVVTMTVAVVVTTKVTMKTIFKWRERCAGTRANSYAALRTFMNVVLTEEYWPTPLLKEVSLVDGMRIRKSCTLDKYLKIKIRSNNFSRDAA